jgi:hypothetical protein
MDDPQMRTVLHRMSSVTSGVAMIVAAVLVAGARPALARPSGPQPDAAPSSAAVDHVGASGTPALSPAEVEQVRATLRRWTDENTWSSPGGVVRVAFHVITARGEGDADTIRELNLAFEGTGYRFELLRADRTDDPGWYRMAPGSGSERKAKQALAIEPARTLNIYVCSPAQGLSGWASYPWVAPESHFIHGVVLDHSVLPGGSASPQLGRGAILEVGHYLGLIDTDDARGAGFSASRIEHMRSVVSIYRPSLFSAPVPLTVEKPEIVPSEGAEPEDGRVLSYRGPFPNPFHAETALRFTLPTRQPVSLRIYSVTGQLVRTLVDAPLPPGDHSAMFRADDLPSGAYFAVLRVGGVQMSRTLMLIR